MLYRRGAVLILALLMLGAAFQGKKPEDKKAEDRKPDDKKPLEKEAPVRVSPRLPRNYKKLGLRDDQIKKIYKIRTDAQIKQDALKRQLEKVRADEMDAVRKVLTPEQLKLLREINSGEKVGDK